MELENSSTRLGDLLRKFKSNVCSAYVTQDLPSEEAARGRRQAAKAAKAAGGPQATALAKPVKKKSKIRTFNMDTYKLHSFPDIPVAIHACGAIENTSTKNVCSLIYLYAERSNISIKGEGEHKRSKQLYPRVHKGDHVRGIARHVYRERLLFQAQQVLRKQQLMDASEVGQNTNTLDIPLEEEEVLDPTPPEQHHHISKDVRHKVDILKWLADNRKDPALKVSRFKFA
jgi:hypothetical protein